MTKQLQPMTEENRDAFTKARTESYVAATTALRERNRDEYNQLVVSEMADRGFEWAPRPTGRDRILEQIKALADKGGLGVDEVAAALMPAGDDTVTSQ